MDENVESHEENARPDSSTSCAHHVCDRGPVVDNHEGVQRHHARAKIVEVDHVVHIVGDTVLAVESRFLDKATEAVDADDGEDVVDDVQAGELVQQRRSHLHDHLHDDFELFALLEQDRDSHVAHQEGEGEKRCSVRKLGIVIRGGEQVHVGHNREGLANDFEDVEFLLPDDCSTVRCENDHGAFDEENGCEGHGEHSPEAGPDLLDVLELVVHDEDEGDGHVEEDEDDLDPAVKETRLAAPLLHRPAVLVRISTLVRDSHCIERVDVLKLRNFNEVLKLEELLDSGKLDFHVFFVVLSRVLSVENSQNLLRDAPVGLVVIVIIEDILQESLGLHVIEHATAVGVVLVKDDLDVLDSIPLAL